MLSPTEVAARDRGQELRRVMRAAGAMNGLYDDLSIADAAGVHRNTVAGWWKGATPEPSSLQRLSEATGLALEDLAAFVYYGGPAPRLEWPRAEPRQEAPELPRLTPQQRAEAERWQADVSARSNDNPPQRSSRRASKGG